MLMLLIVAEPKKTMWYSGMKGQLAQYCGNWAEAYKSREPAGYTNRVEFSDAAFVEAEVEGVCPGCGKVLTFGSPIGDYPRQRHLSSNVPRALAYALKKHRVECKCGATLKLDLPFFEPADTHGAVGVKMVGGKK